MERLRRGKYGDDREDYTGLTMVSWLGARVKDV
jgi:hypothetical protein